jgi:hypothetical protein
MPMPVKMTELVKIDMSGLSVPQSTHLCGRTFASARIVGEMTWAVTEIIGPANLIRYEGELNRFALRYPQIMLCLYNLDHFHGDLLVDIMKTHPKVLMGPTVLENLYYVPPDELATSRQ